MLLGEEALNSREECAAVGVWADRAFSTGAAGESSVARPSNPKLGYFEQLPFSFVYGGRPSAELLPSWGRRENVGVTRDGRERRIIAFTDPVTKLEMRAEITRCKDFPAVDWVLRFTNKGQTDSPLLEQVLPLSLNVGVPGGDVIFHHAYGSTARDTDYIPIDEPLVPGSVVNLASVGGRSSNGVLPFFTMEWPQGGMAWAVGWSGQWSQQVRRLGAGAIGIKAGQQVLRARLRPGESIRTPRILLLSWRGTDTMRGNNQLRRLLLAHYVPRRGGEIVMPPVTQNSWFVDDFGNGTTEKNQLEHIRALPALGVEAWWLDAGWFDGGSAAWRGELGAERRALSAWVAAAGRRSPQAGAQVPRLVRAGAG